MFESQSPDYRVLRELGLKLIGFAILARNDDSTLPTEFFYKRGLPITQSD
ncbi:MAG: hypothetical protein LC776_04175 [Acidobacteria bacterium]|nr:hypothetical protein [Acidobacteriota bacterium]